jgi:hypothetical protein
MMPLTMEPDAGLRKLADGATSSNITWMVDEPVLAGAELSLASMRMELAPPAPPSHAWFIAMLKL